MIDFTNVKSIFIKEGEVITIARGNEILWQKQTKKYNTELEYIESNGKQYIDTGYLMKTTTDIEFIGSISDNTKTGWIAGAPVWVGIHKKLGQVAITQTSTGMTYNDVDIKETFKIGVFGDKVYFNDIETNTITRKNSTLTLFLFGYHHTNDTGSITASIRMKAFKIWENNILVRDYIPVLDLDNRPCLFDRVSEECFYNQGTEEFTYLEKQDKKYKEEIEYLESNGSQFIDTGYAFNSNTDAIELDYACLETAQYKWIFGNYVGKYLGLSTHSYQTLWYGATSVRLGFTDFNTDRHKLIINENGVHLDSNNLSNFTAFENSANLYLFAMNYNGTLSTGYKGKAKVWSYKHIRNGILIRDLIPVLDYDNEPCMYDKVSDKLFYNKGTGSFKTPPQ